MKRARVWIGFVLVTASLVGCSTQASTAEEEEGAGGGDQAGQAATRTDGESPEEQLAAINTRYKGAKLKLTKAIRFDVLDTWGKPYLYRSYLGLGFESCALRVYRAFTAGLVADPTDYTVSSIVQGFSPDAYEKWGSLNIYLTEKGNPAGEYITCSYNTGTRFETVMSWLSSRLANASLVPPTTTQAR